MLASLKAPEDVKDTVARSSRTSRTRPRQLHRAKRLSFDTLEGRELLSHCEGLMAPPGGYPVPDPPDSGDYTRPPVKIGWTCKRIDPFNAALSGDGSYSSPVPADPDVTQTITVTVSEAWRFQNAAWTRVSRIGAVNDTLNKDVPNWQEQTWDTYRIEDAADVKAHTYHYLHKVVIALGDETHESQEWTQEYAVGNPVSKTGYESSSTVTQVIPVTGAFMSLSWLNTWTGPVEWTHHTDATDISIYQGGRLTDIDKTDNDETRVFANPTDPAPASEFDTAKTFKQKNFASGRPEEQHWTQTNTGLYSVLPPFWTELVREQDLEYFDRDGDAFKLDHREATNSINGLQQLRFSRTTDWRENGSPEDFSWFLQETGAASDSLSLAWNDNGQLTSVTQNTVVWVMPLNDEQKQDLLVIYQVCKNREGGLFGYVLVSGYPDLGLGVP